jgi:tetratricopeptide (TPR) repeat protein
MRRALAVLAVLFVSHALAQLTEGERRLLQGAITVGAANESGKAADAAALERIVALGDPELVRAFSRGLDTARVEQMPADLEAIVIRHFDDQRVGAALRALFPRYRTRKLFDLHYARLQGAFKADEPSFKEILRTDQPGIDEDLMRIADKFPVARDELPPVPIFVGTRHHPAAIPALVASIDPGYRVLGRVPPMHNRPLGLLLEYPDVGVWRRAGDELERLKREGRVTDEAYAAGRQQIDRALADPELTLARMRARDARVQFEKRRAALGVASVRIDALRDESPRMYADQQAKYLARLDEIAREIGDEGVAYDVADQYFTLGMMVRFQLRDPREAVTYLEKAAAYHHAMGQVALADTYQLALNDRNAALAAYERALAEVTTQPKGRLFFPYSPQGNRMNDFWRAWLAQEVEFMRTGKPFQGRIPENVIAGFFDALYGNAGYFIDAFGADVPLDTREVQGFAGMRVAPSARLAPPARDWSDVEASFDRVDKTGLAGKLAKLPPSRLYLFVSLRPVSALSAADILRYFARNDPSGYWTTCLLGTVSYLDSRAAERRELAVRTGAAQLMPGMAASGKPNALSSAASQFLASRGLRVKPEAR